MKTAVVSQKYLSRLASGRLLSRQGELDHFPPLLRGNPLHALREVGRYIKLNYFRHESVLQFCAHLPSTDLPSISTAVPLPSALTARAIAPSEFLRSALHTAHDRIHTSFALLILHTH